MGRAELVLCGSFCCGKGAQFFPFFSQSLKLQHIKVGRGMGGGLLAWLAGGRVRKRTISLFPSIYHRFSSSSSSLSSSSQFFLRRLIYWPVSSRRPLPFRKRRRRWRGEWLETNYLFRNVPPLMNRLRSRAHRPTGNGLIALEEKPFGRRRRRLLAGASPPASLIFPVLLGRLVETGRNYTGLLAVFISRSMADFEARSVPQHSFVYKTGQKDRQKKKERSRRAPLASRKRDESGCIVCLCLFVVAVSGSIFFSFFLLLLHFCTSWMIKRAWRRWMPSYVLLSGHPSFSSLSLPLFSFLFFFFFRVSAEWKMLDSSLVYSVNIGQREPQVRLHFRFLFEGRGA